MSLAGALRVGTAMRAVQAGVLADDAFEMARRALEIGDMPTTWGEDRPALKPWNFRAPGRIFAAGQTLLVADPARRDPTTGLPLHRVITTAAPEFKSTESLLTAPKAGLVEGDPETVIIIDMSGLGYRLCAALEVDPAEYLVTPEPERGWS